MQFDWFTFGASLFNFILLLVLLRVLVFKRIVRAMETREKRLAKQWDEAQEAEDEAEATKQRYESKLADIEEERKETLDQARKEFEEERKRRREELRQEMQDRRNSWEQSIRAEREQFLSELRNRLGQATVDTVRATLEELADEGLEKKMIDRFFEQYEPPEMESGETIEVYTSHPLPEDERSELTERLSDLHSGASSINVAVDDSLLCGIEVRFSDTRVGFSLAHHLDDVEERLRDLLADGEEEGNDGE